MGERDDVLHKSLAYMLSAAGLADYDVLDAGLPAGGRFIDAEGGYG
jgi:hypothetical protein